MTSALHCIANLRVRSRALAQSLLVILLIATAYSSQASPPPAAVTLDEMVALIKKEVAARHGASLQDVQVVSATTAVWRDTSLGCGKPTEAHARIELEGFRVVVEYAGQRFDYRARSDGRFLLCEAPLSRSR